MTTVTYLSGASNETYSGGAFNYIAARIDGINDAANALGISAGAIAGAMAEENTAYGFLDTVLDKYARSGYRCSHAYPGVCGRNSRVGGVGSCQPRPIDHKADSRTVASVLRHGNGV